MNLKDFQEQLSSRLSDEHSRPFVCQGSPLDCKSFIVGFNAATTLPHPFFHYWDDSAGFDYSEFQKDYGLTRKKKGNRPIIEAISDELGSSFETNLFAIPTAKARDLAKKNRKDSILPFLFFAIRPTLVFVHSKPAIQFMAEVTGHFANQSPELVKWEGHEFLLAGRPGPLYTLGIENARAMARSLRAGWKP